MGKKSTTKASKNSKPARNNTWLVLGGAVFMVGIVWGAVRLTHPPKAADNFNPEKAPATLIATLNPADYTGKARAAYQVAKDIPEILSQLPCFCGCMDGMGHKSNLYCFADKHGAICDLCQNIALDAQEMHRKGMPVSQIRDKIRAAYGSERM
jgi:hypothetical protein